MLSLSIIVPLYNTEPYIRPCLESLYRQGLDENTFEVIVVNDGSTDKSMERVSELTRQHANLTVIDQENQGISVARNNGMAKATGEFLLFMDSDDVLIDNSLPPLLETARKAQADITVAQLIRMTDKEIAANRQQAEADFTVKETDGRSLLLASSPYKCQVCRVIFKTDFLKRNNLLFIPGICFEDAPFMNTCYVKAGRCVETSHLFYIYRTREGSLSAKGAFSMTKAHSFCIAILNVWRLTRHEGLDSQQRTKLNDLAFDYYNNLLMRTLFTIDGMDNKVHVLKMLKAEAPEMRFTNGWKQRLTTLLYRHLPGLYMRLLVWRKERLWKLKD